MSKNLREYKLVVVGGGGVGKSCLTVRFVEDKFSEEYDPTIEDAYMKKCVVDGEEVLLSVLDTAGQDDYTAMREHYMRPGEGFLLVYSITDKASFQELRGFYEQICRVKDKDFFPMIVVGTKCDLEFNRQVDASQGRAFAQELRGRFIETSAKQRINVDAAFIDLVKLIRQYQRDQLQTRAPPKAALGISERPDYGNDRRRKDRGCCSCIVA